MQVMDLIRLVQATVFEQFRALRKLLGRRSVRPPSLNCENEKECLVSYLFYPAILLKDQSEA